MKSHLNKFIYIYLFFILLIFSQLIWQKNFTFAEKDISIQNFNSQLNQKENQVDNYLDSLAQNTVRNHLTDWLNVNASVMEYLFEQKGYLFYLYEDNQLKYWSNNALVLPNNNTWIKNGFVKLDNAYVVIRTKQIENITAVGLIVVKLNYPYENNFLKNDFHASFHINQPLSIYQEKDMSPHAVYSKDKTYLFSLQRTQKSHRNISNQLSYTLILLALIALLFAARKFLNYHTLTKQKFIQLAVTMVSLRFIFQYFHFPEILYQLEIFKPKYLAFSQLFPSIGELLITTLIVAYLSFVFYINVPISALNRASRKKITVNIAIWFVILTTYSGFAFYIFHHLIIDSNFQFEAYDVLNLSVFSFIGYFIIVILFMGLILLFDKACLQLKKAIAFKHLVLLILIYFVGLGVYIYFTSDYFNLVTWLSFLAIFIYWSYVRIKAKPNFTAFVIVIVIFSVFATYYIRTKNFHKRIEESKVLALNLAREQDPVAEIILAEMIQSMPNDTTITHELMREDFDFDNFIKYINQNYFTGYLKRYIFQLTICNKYDSLQVDNNPDNISYCYGFFDQLISKSTMDINVKGLYFLRTNQGEINYFLKIPIPLKNGWDDVTLFFELSTKPNYEVLGYPELLLEKPIKQNEIQEKANYAKYINNRLVKQNGEFPYSYTRDFYGYKNVEFAFFQSENYDHILYNPDESNTLIISYPTVNFYNILISFTYIFLFLLIQISLLLLFVNRLANLIEINFNIKNKIIYSMIIILLMSLLFVGSGTIFYTYRQFEKNQYNILSEKIQSVLVELEHKLAYANEIHEIDPDYLNSLLVKFSNVFFTDINLYDLDGRLVGTSRNEIFERHLTSKKINATAYRELILNHKARIVHKEKIGKMEYYSAYIPFTSANNQLLAYLNLPYFSKETVLRQELMRVVVAIVNIYAFLIILSLIVAVYISNKLTQPLRLVQQRIQKINLGVANERIDYVGNDEMAELVLEYNRMLDEIDKSARLLAKSERESAWHEMARQIAHEIKNPLTPMKLSIQLLQRSWENNDKDFGDRFKRASQTLIQQINSLSSIATAFSDFAKMPTVQYTKVNIVERVQRSVELFVEHSPGTIKLQKPENTKLFVNADKEKLLQVFNNLIKNANYAIAKVANGLITITFKQENEQIIVAINDNGEGIPEFMKDKLFEPNFTTKSSGTGLGLAIIKNIVEEFQGSIYFESTPEKGTTFFVSLPCYKNQDYT